jgi:O-antigen ligase
MVRRNLRLSWSSSIDKIIGTFILIQSIGAPWILGGTTNTGFWFISILGFCLGGGLFFKKTVTWFQKRRDTIVSGNSPINWPLRSLYFWAVATLFYVLVSVVNARSNLFYTFYPGSLRATGVEIEYFDAVSWLPHSYGSNSTFKALLKYLALFATFLAARDWFSGSSLSEEFKLSLNRNFPNIRIQFFLWTLALSSCVLAFVGMLQRLDKTERLLWLFENHINGGSGAFGPFPYQSNAAQYLNLVWPVILAFWLNFPNKINIQHRLNGSRTSDVKYLLLVCVVVMASGVVLTKSKGGVIVLLGLVLCVAMIMRFLAKRGSYSFFTLNVCLIAVILLGIWLGGWQLLERFVKTDLSTLNGRKFIYDDAAVMVDDFKLFGSGAETFAPLYYFYRKTNPFWDAYVHNDYLETVITFGWVGVLLIVFTCISMWAIPFFGYGISTAPEFLALIGLAMGGMLFHACFDLPFQIYSLQLEFILMCALFSCLKLERR